MDEGHTLFLLGQRGFHVRTLGFPQINEMSHMSVIFSESLRTFFPQLNETSCMSVIFSKKVQSMCSFHALLAQQHKHSNPNDCMILN